MHEQQPVVEEQQEAENMEDRMQLRPHNLHPPGCRIKGRKTVPPPVTQRYKRLR